MADLSSLNKVFFSNPTALAAPARKNEFTVFKDSASPYFILPSLPVNHLTNGEIIAVPQESQGQIVGASIVEGQLPDGVTLHPNGLVIVTESRLLQADQYLFSIETVSIDNQVGRYGLSLDLEEPASPDRDAVFSIRPGKYIQEYVNHDVLASAYDHDGKVIDAVCVKGKLPEGTSLRKDGKIVVTDHKMLQEGTYPIWIATADEKKGITMFILTLQLQEGK